MSTPRIPPPYGQTFSPQRLRLILGEIDEQIPGRDKEGDLAERVRKHVEGLETARDDFYQRKVEDLEGRLEGAITIISRWQKMHRAAADDRDRWFRYFILHLVLDVVVVLVVLGLWGKP